MNQDILLKQGFDILSTYTFVYNTWANLLDIDMALKMSFFARYIYMILKF